MTLETVVLALPEAVIERAQQAADILHRPLNDILSDALQAALPDMGDVPSELRTTLVQMTWMSDQELWAIAHREMSEAQQTRLWTLSDAQLERELKPEEQAELDDLLHEYDRITLCKARAYALLSLRSGKALLASS